MAEVHTTIKGYGPPTNKTRGSVGQDYVDLNTGIMYECVEAFSNRGYKFTREIYTWEKRGIDMDIMATDKEVEAALDGYVFAEITD